MDRLRAMMILLRTADSGSLSAASRQLGIPLPTVSRTVSELEAHLGARLLVRSTRKLSLTEAGEAYVAVARRILEQVDDAERQAAGQYTSPRGELLVTAPVAFGRLHLLPIVTEFLATYPEINVQLLLSDRNLHLIDENVDVALRIGVLPDSSLVATNLGSTRYVLCGSPELLAAREPRSPKDIADLPLISFTPLTPVDTWTFSSAAGRRIEIPIRPRLSVSTADAALDAAIAGVGLVRLLDYQCADAIANGSLRVVLPEFEPEPLPVQLLHAGRDKLPFKTRVFLDFAAGRMKARLVKKPD